jgi:hypothetical protein
MGRIFTTVGFFTPHTKTFIEVCFEKSNYIFIPFSAKENTFCNNYLYAPYSF